MPFLVLFPSYIIQHLPEHDDLPSWPLFHCQSDLTWDRCQNCSDRRAIGKMDYLHFWVYIWAGLGVSMANLAVILSLLILKMSEMYFFSNLNIGYQGCQMIKKWGKFAIFVDFYLSFWTHIRSFTRPWGIWGFRIFYYLSFEPKFSLSQAVPRELAPIQFWLIHAIGDSERSKQNRSPLASLRVEA